MRRTSLAALLVASLLTPAAAQAASPQAATIGVGVVGRPGSLNPMTYTSQAAADILSATSDGLLRFVPTSWPRNNQRYAWRPDLLAAMPILRVTGTPGPTATVTITYRLRRGLRWSDGQPLTSRDIRFTWHAVMQPQSGAYQGGYDQITSVETPSPLTAVVQLQGTYAAWQTLFSFLLPYHALHGRIAAIATDRSYNRMPLSTGPYAVVYDQRGRVVLRANPYYAGQDGPAPRIERIVVRYYPSESLLRRALERHEIAVADNLQLSEPGVAALRKAGITVQSVPGPAFEQFTFNLFRPTSGSLSVRRAFYLALDRQGMSRRLSGGRFRVASSDQAVYSWALDAKLPPVRQNIALARRILQQDGWVMGPHGYFMKGGRVLSLNVSLTATPLHKAIMAAVIRQEARAGIRVRAQYRPVAALFGPSGMLARGNYQAALFSFVDGADPNDASLFNSQTGSRYAYGVDFSGYNSAAVDAWTADALARMSMGARARDYHRVQSALYRDLPMVPLFFLPVETAYNAKAVSGITVDDFGGSLWSASRWHLR